MAKNDRCIAERGVGRRKEKSSRSLCISCSSCILNIFNNGDRPERVQIFLCIVYIVLRLNTNSEKYRAISFGKTRADIILECSIGVINYTENVQLSRLSYATEENLSLSLYCHIIFRFLKNTTHSCLAFFFLTLIRVLAVRSMGI